jgi:transcriptional regulator with XRE-family HTH domain
MHKPIKGMRNALFTCWPPLLIVRLQCSAVRVGLTIIQAAMENAVQDWSSSSNAVGTRWAPHVHLVKRVQMASPTLDELAVCELVSANLKALRKQHRLSLEELSRQSGVSRAMLGQVEQGKSVPSIKILWQIAQAMGVTVSWFLQSQESDKAVLLQPDPAVPALLPEGKGELRSLRAGGEGGLDAFYELRLAPGSAASLPAIALARRVNVAVANGVLHVDVEQATYRVHPREALQYEVGHTLAWRNAGPSHVQAFITVSVLQR